MQVSERGWIYDVGFPGRLLRHSMTDLACTYPILNGLILNGIRNDADARDQRLPSVDDQKPGTGQRVYSPNKTTERAVLT